MMTRPIMIAAVALLFGVGVGAWTYARAIGPQIELGVGYGARVACACRYIGHRDLKSCYKDFEPGMEAIHLADDPATRTVTASVPLVASRAVRFDPELGCQPEPYQGNTAKRR